MLLLLLLLLLLLFTHHWPDADLGSRAQVLYKSPCKKKKRTSALQVAVQSYPSLRIELNGLHSESQMGRGNELAGREELGEHGGALAREDVALGDVDEVPVIAASGPQEPAHGDAAVAVAAVPGAVDGRDGLAGPDASEVRQSSASALRFRLRQHRRRRRHRPSRAPRGRGQAGGPAASTPPPGPMVPAAAAAGLRGMAPTAARTGSRHGSRCSQAEEHLPEGRAFVRRGSE